VLSHHGAGFLAYPSAALALPHAASRASASDARLQQARSGLPVSFNLILDKLVPLLPWLRQENVYAAFMDAGSNAFVRLPVLLVFLPVELHPAMI
jgi:hypothetical protein